MIINYWAVLVCAVLAMALGFLWYGPLFGKKWMNIVGVGPADLAARQKMMQNVWKLYVAQFVLDLFQVWVLACYIVGWQEASGLVNALWI